MADNIFRVGNHVKITGKDVFATVAFVGSTKFAPGKWVGVVLKEPVGRNNGTVDGVSYFKCDEKCGLFVRQTQLEKVGDDGSPSTPKSGHHTPSSAPRSSVKRRMEPTRLPIAGGGSSGLSSAMRRTPSSGSGWKRSDSDLTKSAATPASTETSPRTAEANKRMSASFVETNFVESRSPAPLTARQEERVNMQELENLRAEVKDLNEKLETLKIKRAQDKEKLKESEKLKIQVEQLTEFKSRIMESQAQLQRELTAAKNEARDATDSRNRTVEDTQDLADTVEMLTLDKEMAEERAETLQLELDQAREQIEELTVDLEILKEAGAGAMVGGISTTSGGSGSKEESGGATLLQVKQLEQQNQRLHDTLVKMRDVAAHEKHEMQKLSKEMESKKTEVTTLNRVKEQLEQQLQECLTQISDLQEQVDAALGAEDMVETLTQRNLDLEEQALELEEQVKDLEDINYTNDLLVEGAKEQELELREDLDLAMGKLRETERERDALGTVIVDRDETITKFRELVQTLTDQNSDLRSEVQRTTNRPVDTPSEVIDFKKLFSETKAHSAAIDLELRQLELQQSLDHVSYLKQYLPDNFMTRGGDQDAVNFLLLLPRLLWKAEVVIGGVSKFTQPETIDQTAVLKGHAVDQFAFATRVRQLLYTLQSCVYQFNHAVNHGSVEQFLALGGLYPEMAAHERALDQYVQMLKKDQLDENVGLELLEKIVSSVFTLQGTHLQSAKFEQPMLLSYLTKAIGAAAELGHNESLRISALMVGNSGGTEIPTFMEIMLDSTAEIQGIVKRIKRRLPQDGSAGPITYPGEVQKNLISMAATVSQAASTLRQVGRACVQQAGFSAEAGEGVSCPKIKELIHQATDLIYGSEDQGPESVKVSLLNTQDQLSAIATSLEKGEYDYDGTPPETGNETPPIIQRAQNIKAELKDSEHIKFKLESKEQDLRDLRLLMKQKNEELSEMVVRRDLAEKKLSTATKDADATIEKLQRKLDDANMLLKRKEKEFEETMDHLQSDIDSLESEKGELREKLKAFSKRNLYDSLGSKNVPPAVGGLSSPSSPAAPSSISVPSAPPTSGGMVKDSPHLVQQVEDLRAALKYSQMIAAQSAASDIKSRIAKLAPIPKFHRVLKDNKLEGEEKKDLGKEEGAGEQQVQPPQPLESDGLNELAQQTAQLRKDLKNMISKGCVVDLSKRKAATVPASDSLKPLHQIQHHRNQILAYQCQLHKLQNEAAKMMASSKTGGSVSSHFRPFPSPQLTKALAEKGKLVQFGEVTLGKGGPTSPVPVVVHPQQVHQLHSLLLA